MRHVTATCRSATLLVPVLFLAVGAFAGWASAVGWQAACQQMVQEAVIAGGVENQRVLAAMRATPRHEFVPESQQQGAYLDMALPIGGGQTITSPLVVARMTEALDPQPADRVLEIGTGSGYQAAVLSSLVGQVFSIEIVESLARRAARTLHRLGYRNVFTKPGDGFAGWPEHAPFDKIVVTCSPEKVPPALVEQLREDGQMIIPLGERFQQTLYRLRKVDGKLQREKLEPTFFVPMTGRAEDLRDAEQEDALPRLINGEFEDSSEHDQPAGWYYIRQANIVADRRDTEANRVLRLQNEMPGRGAQVLQALGTDGRRVRRIELSASVKGRGLRAGQNAHQVPRIEITFYDRGRAPIDSRSLGPWSGTFEWRVEQMQMNVPSHARLSVLAVALFGGVGELEIDRVDVRVVETQPPK